MTGLIVDFDRYIQAHEKGIADKDFIVDAANVIQETSTASYRSESDFNKRNDGKRRSNMRREFALPIDYSKQQQRKSNESLPNALSSHAALPMTTTTQKSATTEVQEMSVIKLDDLTVNVAPEEKLQLPQPPTPNIIMQYAVADNKIDLINLAEASVIAPLLKAIGKSLYIPFALELCEIGEIRSDTCIDSEVWGDMCPVEIKGIGGATHTVNLPSSSGIYIAPTYLIKQLGDIFILRNSSFTMDLMMRRDSGQIEIGHRLMSPTGMNYGTVIHYGTIASHKDQVGEVWMLVQRISSGWHVPMKIKPVKTVLTGSSQIAQQAAPTFDARVSTKEIVASNAVTIAKLKPVPIVTQYPFIGKGSDLYPMSM